YHCPPGRSDRRLTGGYDPVKKHGPGIDADVILVTPLGDPVEENDDTALPPPIRSSEQGGPDGTSEQSERLSPAHQAQHPLHSNRRYRCAIDFSRGSS